MSAAGNLSSGGVNSAPRPGLLVGLCVLSVALSGCYGAQVFREPITVEEMSDDVRALREQQVELLQRLRTLEDQLAQVVEMSRSERADAKARSDELNAQLLAIQTQLSDALRSRSNSGSSQSNSRNNDWWANPGGRAASPGGERPEGLDAPSAADSTSRAGDRGSASDPAYSDGSEEKRIYDQAYLDLTRGNYALAILGFRDCLRRSPATELSDNAQYWIGESYYAQSDFEMANQEFMKLLAQYTKGDKAPAALLKIGYSYARLNDTTSSVRYLRQVIEQYPNSDEATLAKNKLQSIE